MNGFMELLKKLLNCDLKFVLNIKKLNFKKLDS